jgi:agmatinase
MQTWDQFMTEPNARIGVLGIAYDEHSSYQRGPADAPPLIRLALNSGSANLWSENGTDLGAEGILVDVGDISISPDQDMFTEIEGATRRLLEHRLCPLVLGGDHTVTVPIIKAMLAHHPRLSILHFDAHPDLYDHFEGDSLSHACTFARIMEMGLVERLVQIGIRTANGQQREQAERFGVEVIEMKDWHDNLRFEFATPLYISFDMDCLDPAFAPGVSHWEPGGLSTRQVLGVLRSLRAPIVGADLVEFNPRVEAGITAMTAAKVFKEIAAKMLEGQVSNGA